MWACWFPKQKEKQEKMKNKILFVFIVLFIFTNNAFSQCALCKINVESNLESGDTKGAGLNEGILFLMAMPYILVLVFGVFYYIQKQKTLSA